MRIVEFTLEQAVSHKHLIQMSQTYLSFKVCPSSQAKNASSLFPSLIFLKLHNQTLPVSQNTVNLFYEVSIRAWLRAQYSDLNLTSVTCLCERPRLATSPSFQIMWFSLTPAQTQSWNFLTSWISVFELCGNISVTPHSGLKVLSFQIIHNKAGMMSGHMTSGCLLELTWGGFLNSLD